ncbi:hypothetical protein ID866_9802, partial [Astraeus odoratus]
MSKNRRTAVSQQLRHSPTHMATSDDSDLPYLSQSKGVSTSAHSILPSFVGPSTQSQGPGRSSSPPASSYFPSVSASQTGEPEPTPGASTHFAYSTTLRRHHHEHNLSIPLRPPDVTPDGLWKRTLNFVTGRRSLDDSLEDCYPLVDRGSQVQERPKETPSARFACWTVENTVTHFRSSITNGLPQSAITTLQQVHGYNEFSVSAPESALLKIRCTLLYLCLLIFLLSDEREVHILANDLVPGDIVTLTTGDRVPADIRIISAVDLEIDESSLTGETTPRLKSPQPCGFQKSRPVGETARHVGHEMEVGEPIALADRSCIAYMGTLVRNGRGRGIVIATGTTTEFGVIFSMMQDVEEKRTPLQLSMDELAKKLSMLSFGIIGVICLIGTLQQRPWLDMFTIGVSLAVAAIPEGLPIVTTVTLALGVLRMARRKAIVKKLHSVEALGSVSMEMDVELVSGTLTKNEQTVTEIYVVDECTQVDSVVSSSQPSPPVRKALEIGSLCNNASLARNEDGVYIGQSTDVALLNVLPVFGLHDPRDSFTRLSERPFNSEQKYMAVSGIHAQSALYSGNPQEMYYIKGSIDAVLDRCRYYYVSDASTPPLDSNTRAIILSKAQSTASRGLRVLAMAYGYGSMDSPKPDSNASVQHALRPSQSLPATRVSTPEGEKANLVFVGFQAMLDPPRKGVADAIGLLQSGGVQVVMITGDAEETALAIAKKLGLRVGSGRGQANRYCLTGKELDQLTKAQLVERVGSITVFARTTPRHKMAIVEAFQARGAVVAMTGDGVNDAPALKMADIGVSMGKSGTDVAKEAADMILVDDNFSTILPAVEEGNICPCV